MQLAVAQSEAPTQFLESPLSLSSSLSVAAEMLSNTKATQVIRVPSLGKARGTPNAAILLPISRS